jgi:hypothetical protein
LGLSPPMASCRLYHCLAVGWRPYSFRLFRFGRSTRNARFWRMDCEKCANLLAVYRLSVRFLRDAVEKGSGAIFHNWSKDAEPRRLRNMLRFDRCQRERGRGSYHESAHAMCKTCTELLAEYKLWVSLFKDAVLNIPGALGNDSRMFLECADSLRLQCNHTSRGLMEHWQQEHTNLAVKAGSSEPSGS